MFTENEQLKLKQLEKVLDMMHRCNRYLDGDKKVLQTEACNWLPTLKADAEKRVELRTRVLRRLSAYYAKKCFGLYLASLQMAENEHTEPPFKLNTEAGWNPDGVRYNNELLIYGVHRDINAVRA